MDFGYVTTSSGHSAHMESWDCEYAIIFFELGIIGFAVYMFFFATVILRSLVFGIMNPELKGYMALILSNLLIVSFMKTNVSIFAEQITYNEYINIAISSYFISGRYSHRQDVHSFVNNVHSKTLIPSL